MREILLLLVVLSGCLSSPPTSISPPSPSQQGWRLDCTLGSYEKGPWVQPCLSRASHTDGKKQEIWLAVHPRDPNNVVIGSKDLRPESSKECVWNGLAVTHDGGRTWKDVVIGGNVSERTPQSPYYGYACNTDPMLAFGTDGRVHYVVELYNLGGTDSHGPLGPDPVAGRPLLLPGWKLVLATSTDGGDTWPKAVTLDQTDGIAAINDYSRITVSPKTGSIFVAINTFSGGPFVLAGEGYSFCTIIASRDHGESADRPYRLVPTNPEARQAGCQSIAASADGRLVVASGGGRTFWSWSEDDGRTWSDPVAGFTYDPIPGKFNESAYRTGVNFELAFSPLGGNSTPTLYVIYAARTLNDEADIFVRWSQDYGHSWSDPVRVNDDPPGSHQFMPNIVVAEDGSVHAFFLDKRYDPAHRLVDVTHALSLDGGRTWKNERVTHVSWDGDLGRHQEGFSFIGDYIGIGSSGNVVWGAFPDATLGTTVISAARVVRQP